MKEDKSPFDKLNQIDDIDTPNQIVVPIKHTKSNIRGKEKVFGFYLDADIMQQFKDYAYFKRTTMKQILVDFIKKFLEDENAKNSLNKDQLKDKTKIIGDKKLCSFYLEMELLKQFKDYAYSNKITIREILTNYVIDFLKENGISK